MRCAAETRQSCSSAVAEVFRTWREENNVQMSLDLKQSSSHDSNRRFVHFHKICASTVVTLQQQMRSCAHLLGYGLRSIQALSRGILQPYRLARVHDARSQEGMKSLGINNCTWNDHEKPPGIQGPERSIVKDQSDVPDKTKTQEKGRERMMYAMAGIPTAPTRCGIVCAQAMLALPRYQEHKQCETKERSELYIMQGT